MTHEEAGAFLREIFENSYPKGLVENVDKIYTHDVVGHSNGKEFYYEDIKKRYELTGKHINKFSFNVISWMVFDEFIFAMIRQNWKDMQSQNHYETIVSLVYRIRDNKVCELWFLTDEEVEDYQKTNANFMLAQRTAQVSEKNRIIFYRRLDAAERLWPEKKVRLTERERECLYYYLNGFSSKEIAELMVLSARTVEDYLAEVKDKYQCNTKAELRKKIYA